MSGTVYWVTGLAGAGKTTIGNLLVERLREQDRSVVFLDGDILRGVFGNQGHSLEERQGLAFQYIRLCSMLADQGLDVVCSTVCMFQNVRDWGRENIEKYNVVYVNVPMSVLVERDQKQLYSRALRGEISNIMGVDLPFEEPARPELILNNDGTTPPDTLAHRVLAELG